jgi:glc operon protein GlcG
VGGLPFAVVELVHDPLHRLAVRGFVDGAIAGTPEHALRNRGVGQNRAAVILRDAGGGALVTTPGNPADRRRAKPVDGLLRSGEYPNSHSGRRETMSLTLEEANRIIAGAIDKARQLNIRISAAVVDAGGRLVALQRMDNAIWASAYGSQGKAVASAAFGRASGEMQARADQPTPRGIAAASGGEMIMGQGAVPIIRNGVVIGACGVGGGTSQEDEDCARAGVEKL